MEKYIREIYDLIYMSNRKYEWIAKKEQLA